jgi:hypothetical protein
MLHELEDGDLFDLQFIIDSYNCNSIMPLRDYRLNERTMFNYEDASDVNAILFGIKKWSDFVPERRRRNNEYSGESCSDIDDLIDETDIQRPNRNKVSVNNNKPRADYTRTEQREIVDYLVSCNFHSLTLSMTPQNTSSQTYLVCQRLLPFKLSNLFNYSF